MPLVMQGFANVPASRWLEEARHLYIETPQGLDLSYDPKLRDAAAAAAEQNLPDLWPFFDTLSGKPVCAIRGANSTLLSPETFEQMRQRRPDMIDAEVPNRAHVPYLDEPEAVLALRTWLQEMP